VDAAFLDSLGLRDRILPKRQPRRTALNTARSWRRSIPPRPILIVGCQRPNCRAGLRCQTCDSLVAAWDTGIRIFATHAPLARRQNGHHSWRPMVKYSCTQAKAGGSLQGRSRLTRLSPCADGWPRGARGVSSSARGIPRDRRIHPEGGGSYSDWQVATSVRATQSGIGAEDAQARAVTSR
jgi:hypothetical protein